MNHQSADQDTDGDDRAVIPGAPLVCSLASDARGQNCWGMSETEKKCNTGKESFVSTERMLYKSCSNRKPTATRVVDASVQRTSMCIRTARSLYIVYVCTHRESLKKTFRCLRRSAFLGALAHT